MTYERKRPIGGEIFKILCDNNLKAKECIEVLNDCINEINLYNKDILLSYMVKYVQSNIQWARENIGKDTRLPCKARNHNDVSFCETCGKEFQQIWCPQCDAHTDFKTCPECRMKKAVNNENELILPNELAKELQELVQRLADINRDFQLYLSDMPKKHEIIIDFGNKNDVNVDEIAKQLKAVMDKVNRSDISRLK